MRWALIALIGCSSSSPAKPRACDAKLAELARFARTVADEQDASPLHAGLIGGRARLVTVDGPPGDASRTDLLLIAPGEIGLVAVDGTVKPIAVDELLLGGLRDRDTLVIGVAPDTPWHVFRTIYGELPASFAIAYRARDAFTGRTPPAIQGAEPDHVDVALVARNLAATTEAHCPGIAKLAAGGRLDTAFLRAVATEIPTCDCDVDLALIEAIPWLVRRPVLTLDRPKATSGERPPIPDAKDDATWEEVVRANGGHPLAIAPPTPPPAPPPPPRKR